MLRRAFGDKVVVFTLLVLINKGITTNAAAPTIAVSNRSIEKYIEKLKSDEIIERIGSDYGEYWTIKNTKN